VGKQGNRDREQEGNLGHAGRDSANPAGTSGRTENWQKGNTDPNRPASKPARVDDDEDSALGNRAGFR
jgi:hypothetical protein